MKYNKQYGFYKLKFLLMFLVASAVFSLLVMLLWNWLIPVIFNGPLITYWQALGILILARLLTGGLPGNKPGHYSKHMMHVKKHWREKWEDMSPEEKEAMKKKYRNRCGPFFKDFEDWDEKKETPSDSSASNSDKANEMDKL